MGEKSELDYFPRPPFLWGVWRRSSKIFNLVFQIFICFLSFILFFLPDIATRSHGDLRWYCTYKRSGERRWLGGHRLVSLFAPLCISGCSVWSARLAGAPGLGLVYWSQKAMQILPFTKWHSAYTVQMGNLQTNSSWSWMRHWQSLNAPQTIPVWRQLTTRANEFPRWDSRAQQTTWRPLTTTESLRRFFQRCSD